MHLDPIIDNHPRTPARNILPIILRVKRQIEWEKGHYYHIYNRGRSKLSIFHQRSNYEFVIRKMARYMHELRVMPVAWWSRQGYRDWAMTQNILS